MPNRKLALSFIFLTALTDSIGFGILMPVLPNLYMEITGEGLAQAAVYGGWLLFAYAIMQFFFAPVLGNLSDAYGRKPVLMASMIALGVNYLIMGFAGSLLVLFIGRLDPALAPQLSAPVMLTSPIPFQWKKEPSISD